MSLAKGPATNVDVHPDLPEAVRQFAGTLNAEGLSFGIVVSRFNPQLTEPALKSAVDALMHHGAQPASISVAWVPGSYEIPTALEVMAAQGGIDALIALGAVIEGETPHASAINAAVSDALCAIARAHQIPVIDGVVVARTMEQAVERCCTGEHSRAWYAAKAAIEMAHLLKRLKDH